MNTMNIMPEQPLIAHLKEIRNRLLWCLAVWIVIFACCFTYAESLYHFIASPLWQILTEFYQNNGTLLDQASGPRMIYTALWEGFFTQVKLAFFSSFCLVFPYLIFHVWRFIGPGLYGHEKKYILPYFLVAPILFWTGVLFAYFVVFPMAWTFFVGFQSLTPEVGVPIVLEAKISEYLALVIQLMLAFGLSFQLPIILVVLVWAGIVDVQQLRDSRRYAVIVILVIAAIITPPDVITQIALTIPLYTLYECAIFCATMVTKRHKSHQDVNPYDEGPIE